MWPAHQDSMVGERLKSGKGNTTRRGHGEGAWSPGCELSNARGFHGLSCQGQREVEGRERACCTFTAPRWEEVTYCPLAPGAKTSALATVTQLLSGSPMGSQASGLQAFVLFIV